MAFTTVIFTNTQVIELYYALNEQQNLMTSLAITFSAARYRFC